MPTINIGGQQINISEEEAQALFRASTASGFIWVTRANPLPTIGTSGVIYVNKSTLDVYLWDSLTQKYIITGFTKEDGTPADTTSLSEVINAIDRLTSATANGLSNTFVTYELATNENHDIVLKGSDGSESKLSIRTKADENTTYQLSLVGNNLKLSGSDGSESFVLLPESSGTRPITYVLTRSVEGDIVLRGSDGSTSMINFKPDTNTTYTLEKDADGNFLFRDSTGNSVTLEDAIGDDFNTTYTLSAEGTTIKLTDSDGNVQSVNLEITDNDTKYEVVKEEDKLYLVSSDGVKVEIDLPEDIDTKYDLKLENGKLTLIEDGEDKTTVTLPEIPEPKVYTLTKDVDKVVLSDGEVTNEVDLSEYKNEPFPDLTGFAVKTDVETALAEKADKTEIPDVSGFATKEELPDISGKADKSEIPDVSGFVLATAVTAALATKADKEEIPDVSNFATKDELPEVPDVTGFATKDEVTEAVSNKANKEDIPDVSGFAVETVVTEALAEKADKSEIPDVSNFATKDELPDISGKADKEEIPDVTGFATKEEVDKKLNIADEISYLLIQSFENNAINITLLDSKAEGSYEPTESTVAVKMNLRKDEEANQLVLEAEVADEVHEISRVQLASDSDTKYKLEKVDNQLRLIPVEDGVDGEAIVVDIEPDINTTYTLSFDEENDVLTFTPSDDTIPTSINLAKFLTANDLAVFGFATTAEVNEALELKADKSEIPDISGKADKSEIPDVSNFATKDELPVVPDVSGFVTVDEVAEGLSYKADKTDIPDVTGFALKTELPDISGKADKSEIPDVSGFAVKSEVDAVLDEKLNAEEIVDYVLTQSYEDNGFNITLLDSSEKVGYIPVESTVNIKVTLRKDEEANQLVLEAHSGEDTYEVSRVQLAADSDTKYKLEKSGNQLRLIPVENGVDGQAIVVDIEPDVNTTYTLDFNNETNVLTFTPSDDTVPTVINLSKFANAVELANKVSITDFNSALNAKADKSEIPDVTGFALKTELPDISGKADKTEIPDVSNFATKDELPVVPDISGLAETTVVNEALALKADKTEIPDVSIYATKEELPELDELFAKNAEISALKDQITVLTRALQELKTPVVETVTELPNVATSMPNDDIKLDDVTIPETTSYNDKKSVTAKSINAENMVMESSTITLNADGDVNVTGLTSSGNLPQLLPDANNKKTNAAMSIHANGDVTIKDCTVGQSGYNTFEIGLNGGYPKNVIIDNVHFEGTLNNNAITIFGHQKNAIITISNCVFDEVSNPVRISNDTNQPATIKFVNCRCDKWEEKYPDYAGFLLLQDWKSANAEEFNTNKRFSNLTITFENCYGPNGKIEGTVEELISNTNKRAMYMYADKAGGIIGYNAELFPSVTTK